MKKLLLASLLAFAVAFVCAPVCFADAGLVAYSASVSTYPATNAHTGTLTADIAGWANVHKILITTDDVTAAQTITFYTFSTSTSTATSSWSIDLDSTTAAGIIGVYQIDFPIEAESWKVQNVICRKSSTSSNIKVTYFYH